MNKIVCDICGTSYAESANQCPICGCVHSGDVQRVTNEINSDGKVSTGYTYVKGGRFSKNNVKKRSNGKPVSRRKKQSVASKKSQAEEPKSSRGLVATAIILLLAIIGVVIYICVRIFAPFSKPNGDEIKNTSPSDSIVFCESVMLDVDTVLFEQEGEGKLLNVRLFPEGTTEKVVFMSENPDVATVSDKGMITAVSEGITTVTVKCGNAKTECTVTVQYPEETTLPGNEETTVPEESTEPKEELRLNRKDFTLSYKGDSWVLYSGSIPVEDITWSSDNESVVTFNNGKAVAVGAGSTNIHAEYEGQKVSCIVHCSFSNNNSGVAGNGGVSEDGGSGNGGNSNIITGTVNVNESLNVRSGPGTTFEKVGTLAAGQKVTITETKVAGGMTWGKISSGWVSMDYIKVD
ncbi:MAG: SH3 domain-containing protein [Oscillospiraceae bacterium]|nr:SH3 domain-containing protein [Oscillospiraceae bacterium]